MIVAESSHECEVGEANKKVVVEGEGMRRQLGC